MEEEKMKQDSVKAPNCEAVGHAASTTTRKTVSMEYAELSLDAPICGDFPFVNSLESVLSLISTALSVISAFISVLFLLLVFAARLLTVSLIATSKWLWKTMEKLNGKGKGRESDVNRGKTNNFLEASFSESDKETRQSNSMVRRSKETNNPNQHGNYKEDHSFDTSPNNPCETANFVDQGYGIDNCFNNYGDGKQDYSYSRVNSSTSKDSYNNHASGLQDLSHSKIYTSKTEDAFNNSSLLSQTGRGAVFDNRDNSNQLNTSDNSAAVRHRFSFEVSNQNTVCSSVLVGGPCPYIWWFSFVGCFMIPMLQRRWFSSSSSISTNFLLNYKPTKAPKWRITPIQKLF